MWIKYQGTVKKGKCQGKSYIVHRCEIYVYTGPEPKDKVLLTWAEASQDVRDTYNHRKGKKVSLVKAMKRIGLYDMMPLHISAGQIPTIVPSDKKSFRTEFWRAFEKEFQGFC